MKPKIVQIPVAELVEDMEVYPRHAVDDAHVSNLAAALEAGVTLPPIVADADSKTITDGWHRSRAYRRAVGPDAVVDVELRKYADKKAMLLDSVELNSAHGRRLDAIDRTRIVVLMRKHKIPDQQIAYVLHVPERKIHRIAVRVAEAPRSSKDTVTGTRTIALKRPVRHLDGAKLTKEQADVHSMLPGTSFLLIARQLRRALEAKMVNLEDEKLLAELRALGEALTACV